MTYKQMHAWRDVPKPGIFVWRFGSLANAYEMIGEPGGSPHIRLGRQKSKRLGEPIVTAISRRVQEDARTLTIHGRGCSLQIDSGWDCRLHIVRRRVDRAKTARWPVRLREGSAVDCHLLAREAADGQSILDYYVLPAEIAQTFPTVLKIRNGREIDRFRVQELPMAIETLLSLISGT